MTPAQAQQLAWLQAPEVPPELVPAERTPVGLLTLGVALRRAWEHSLGGSPRLESLACLLAQWALETGHGASCWNWNLGNQRPARIGSVASGPCLQIPGGKVSEIIGGAEYFFSPPSRGSTFRAFESLEDGADAYLALLVRRFAKAWAALTVGNIDAFNQALHDSGYYTADPARYGKALRSLYHEALYKLGEDVTQPDPFPNGELAALRATVTAQQFALPDLIDDGPHAAEDIREDGTTE